MAKQPAKIMTVSVNTMFNGQTTCKIMMVSVNTMFNGQTTCKNNDGIC